MKFWKGISTQTVYVVKHKSFEAWHLKVVLFCCMLYKYYIIQRLAFSGCMDICFGTTKNSNLVVQRKLMHFTNPYSLMVFLSTRRIFSRCFWISLWNFIFSWLQRYRNSCIIKNNITSNNRASNRDCAIKSSLHWTFLDIKSYYYFLLKSHKVWFLCVITQNVWLASN